MGEAQFSHFVSIQLVKGNGIPLYVQLYDQLVFLIREGKLSPGFLLPPVRKLAAFLSVNPGTAVASYRELEQNGYILTKRGSGSFVADRNGPPVALLPVAGEDADQPLSDMRRISIDPVLFPTKTLKDFISRIIDRDGPAAFTADGIEGYMPLREAVAAAVRDEGINTAPDLIQIVSGSQQGIDIAARALLRHGSFVIAENPTYPGAVSVFRACGAKVADIPLVRGGLDLDRLEELVVRFRPSLLYVTPDIQVPTGISYTMQVKARILALARRYDFYILEDDYANGLCYGIPGRSMKAIDTHDRVLYLRSVSALFAAGLRIAFLIMPRALVPAIQKMKYLSDLATAGLTQRVLDLYLREGKWTPYVEKVRAASEKKLRLSLSAAARHLPPSVSVQKPAGGLSLWLTFPKDTDMPALLAAARARGFLFMDGAPFFIRGSSTPTLRVSFGAASEETIQEAFEVLGELAGKR